MKRLSGWAVPVALSILVCSTIDRGSAQAAPASDVRANTRLIPSQAASGATTAVRSRTVSIRAERGGAVSAAQVISSVPPPVIVGTLIAGTFADATGHSAQSHLVYAANAGVWWLFTLTSGADSTGGTNHVIKAYHSSGADLATSTWTPAADSPGAAASGSCSGCYMGSGRALSVAYLNNAPTDVIHAEIAMAYDGQDGITGHIRAVVTANSVTWETWNYHEEPAATWTMPRAGAIGVSTGRFLHTANPILQQEVDANARRSTSADTGSTWTSGFSAVSVVDNSMINANNAFAFAPLAGETMLAVYDNGGGTATCYNCGQGAPEPKLTNLGYKKSNADGSWPSVAVGSQGGGDGHVFATDATIDQNDWAPAAIDTSRVYVFRRNGGGTGIDAASYNAATNAWSAFTPAPPLLASGQALKSGAGLFAATSGANVYVFGIGTDSANSILYTMFNGTSWTAWTSVPGTDTGQQARSYISGYRLASGNQIGLAWTQGSMQYDVAVGALNLAVTAPTIGSLAPVSGPAGTSVTIAGSGFGASPGTVTFNGTAGTPAAWSDTSISVPVPVGATTGLVVVTASGRSSNGATFTVTTTAPASPAISGLTPTSGPTATVVTIAGSGFGATQGTSTVGFNGATASASAWSDTSITAAVPGAATTGPVVVTVNGVSSNGATFTVSTNATTAPVIDRLISADGKGTSTTAPFGTSTSGEVILAFVASDGPWYAAQSVTVTGAGLVWTLVKRANTQRGTAEIWRATAANRLSNATVTSTQRYGGYDQSLTVVSFSNSGGVGASATAGATAGAPSVSLKTTKAASLVYAVGFDWDRAIARTPGANQTVAHQWVDTAGTNTLWVQGLSAAVALTGTVATVNDTAPTTDRWNLAAVEIVAK